MKVSIIIPVYNVSKYIARCLNSALNQTYSEIEYILINDATPDDSMKIIENLITSHPRKEQVKIIHHPQNKGLAAARNSGVNAASGDYIYFLDSDDEVTSNCIEKLTTIIEKDRVDFVIGEIKVVGNKRNAYPLLLLNEGIHLGNSFILNTFLKRKWYEMAWNKLIKRSFFFEKNCWFEEGILHEDTLWSFQVALAAKSMAVTHTETYFYHIQSNSITQKKSQKNIKHFFFVLKKTIELAEQNHLFEQEKNIFSYLGNLRIFFLKTLFRNNFDAHFISSQKKQLDTLFSDKVWNKQKKSFIMCIKENVINIRRKIKL